MSTTNHSSIIISKGKRTRKLLSNSKTLKTTFLSTHQFFFDMTEKIPWTTLNSGQKMPVLGFGTATMNLPDQDGLVPILLDAIRLGYRNFDTAAIYGTEKHLGLAIKEALRLGIVKSRDELFITSKLWNTDSHPELVLPALRKSLSNLGIEYLDLYLIHWPMSMKPQEASMQIKAEDILPIDIEGVWKAMEDCQKLGLTRSIGVSNFSCKKLSDLLSHSTIPPAVNQVEMNISWNQQKLRDFCDKNSGIKIEAWSPLGASGEVWGSNQVMQNSTLKQIALSKGKTIAQVALRWLYEQNVIIVVKSFNKQRMEENLQIFDWELTQEESDMIAKTPQHKGYDGFNFISPTGTFKSAEELWDGEI
ncbi:hypothetical protein LUZ60_002786 [Juncus effusus]|nr:hypothetical protein LUZ60_002786 [Juncus effusus]